MEYVIPAVLLVLLIGGFVTFLALNATRKSGPAADEEEGTPGIGADSTPLGDTSEHAGEETGQGVAREDAEADARQPVERDAAHVPRPASERLADREA